ncbi:MAG: TadE family protein [Candidatus Microbacterium phytovorans]|uniref:TadE family protein n=1 Tax=Candidatus Microbacterium phytovorans TaxID=3121374 RepID=A0AAJ6B6C8_9MICO|nr:TadE family protein [Microbacterium sp.]WEK14631.1 MAG: TadE family protein [Microbacterium sp.]
MHRAKAWRDDGGAAAVEFLLVGLILLVPIVYLVIALGQIQSGSFAAETASRQIARGVAAAQNAEHARERVEQTARAVAAEYGIERQELEVDIACRPATALCPSAGATLVVTVRVRVALPLVPDVFGAQQKTRVAVEATSVQKMSRLWSAG